MTSTMLSAASWPTLAKNARMGHPRSDTGKERKGYGEGGPPRRSRPLMPNLMPNRILRMLSQHLGCGPSIIRAAGYAISRAFREVASRAAEGPGGTLFTLCPEVPPLIPRDLALFTRSTSAAPD